jgi:cytoskeletal protein RodZ
MKRCPECHSFFPDVEQFCELDGATLIAAHPDSSPVVGDHVEQELLTVLALDARDARRRQYWLIMPLVAVGAVAIGLVLFLVYQGITREDPNSSTNSSTKTDLAQQPPLLSRPAPIASASPSTEPSPSPSVGPSPAVTAESARVALSSSPISTGGDEKARRGPITIRLTNGNTVEADEVWETSEGIWYRRRGVVTLVERDQVKAIESDTEKASPSPSPNGSP